MGQGVAEGRRDRGREKKANVTIIGYEMKIDRSFLTPQSNEKFYNGERHAAGTRPILVWASGMNIERVPGLPRLLLQGECFCPLQQECS